MPTYLLLRDNKQTGPHSYDDMLKLGFRKYDLVWVEGKSAAWRYPGEIGEFKELAPLVEEQPYDRFYKRKESDSGGVRPVAVGAVEANGGGSANAVEAVVGGNSGNSSIVVEAQVAETVQVPPQKTLSDLLKNRRVAVTMPANHTSSPIIAPQKKNPEAEKDQVMHRDPQAVTDREAIVKKDEIPVEITPAELHRTTSPLRASDARYLPKDSAVPQEELKPEKTVKPEPVKEDAELHPAYVEPAPSGRDYTQYLQYAGVAAALVSLLIVGILIGKGMGTETIVPSTVVSEQPSRIDELKKKLQITPSDATVNDAGEQETESIGPVRDLAIKDDIVPAKKDLSVRTSYKTSSAPANTDLSKKGSENNLTVPETQNPAVNLADNLSVTLNDYKVNVFGGIDGVEVTVKNSASAPVEEAVVELRYILSNKNKGYLSETLVFRGLEPGQSKTIAAPKSSRGIRLEYSLVSAH